MVTPTVAGVMELHAALGLATAMLGGPAPSDGSVPALGMPQGERAEPRGRGRGNLRPV